MGGADMDAGKMRAVEILHLTAEGCDSLEIADLGDRSKARSACDHLEPCTQAGMALLHAGLAEMAVVEHDDGEVAGLLCRDRQQAAEPHQLLAVSGDDSDRPLRLRQGQAESDHGGAAHGAPEIEIARVLAGVEHVIGRRAEAAHDKQIAALGKQRLHRLAAIERTEIPHHLLSVHFLRPIIRCEIKTAICWSLSKASEAAAEVISAASSGISSRNTVTPMISSACRVALPIGICQGLNSAHSPRMVTKVRKGSRQLASSDSMLTQLPTPLDCIKSTARFPPSQAPAASATPSSSVVSTVVLMSGSACDSWIRREWPASGT